MKVYYKIKNEETEFINGIDFGSLADTQMTLFMEKTKYKILWALRSIEDDINYEGGMIVINEKGQIETKGFTQETTDKIRALIELEYK